MLLGVSVKIFDTEPLTDCVLVLDFVGETVFETVFETALIDVRVTIFDCVFELLCI